MAYIKTQDNVNLYLKDWGEGRPVIFIHGWPLSADTWDDITMPLAEAGYRCIAYDRRGFGRSGQPFNGYNYDRLADDLATVMETCDVHDATLVGFSMGGGEVARYMSRHDGKRVNQTVLISSVVPGLQQSESNPDGVPDEVFAQMADGMKTDRAAFFGEFFKSFFGANSRAHPVSREAMEWARQIAMQASLKATLACAEAFATTDFRKDLAAFNKPTLVIHGSDDMIVPIAATSRVVAHLIADAQLQEYEGGAHGLFATHKQRLVDDLQNFLAG